MSNETLNKIESSAPKGKTKRHEVEGGSALATGQATEFSLAGKTQAMTEAQAFAAGYAETSAAAATAIQEQMQVIRQRVYGVGAETDLQAIQAEAAKGIEVFTEDLRETFSGYFST